MVQKSLATSIILETVLRVLLLIICIAIGIYFFPVTIHNFVVNTLGYQKPAGFFGFTFADWEVSWLISSSLFSGIIFGALGKKIDYIFIVILFFLSSLDFLFTENITFVVYLGLSGSAILGNVIGYGLKLARKKFWGNRNKIALR